jgi:hypothetical protein
VRQLDIDPARGFSGAVDPSVAPNGTLVRVENLRVDKDGRLVLRAGYTSLGVTVSHTANALTPFDLYEFGDDLIAAGKSSSLQTGIRALYRYSNQAAAVWRTEFANPATADNTAEFRALPAADTIRVALSELSAQQTDTLTADCAALSDGTAVAMVSTDGVSANRWQLTMIVPSTGRVLKVSSGSGLNPRVLAIGSVFYVFYQTGTTVEVRTISSTTQAAISAATVIATGTSAAPLAYDVANYEGTTEYLLVFPTATGYTWRRFNSAHVQQTTTNVASLADAPVSICGSTGENISVLNVRAVSGAELRTFTTASGALAVGPTNLDTSGAVMDWVGLCRFSATQVYAVFHSSTPSELTFKCRATIAAHVISAEANSFNTRPTTKPSVTDSEVYIWESLGAGTATPYGLTRLGSSSTSGAEFLSGIVLDGAARSVYSATTVGYRSQISRGLGAAHYVALVSLDPRDKTYRANLVSFNLNSGQRRQGAQVGSSLVIAGGLVHQYDGRVSAELGLESQPVIDSAVEQLGGALTLLGVYTYQVVFRAVASNGDVTQSAPSDPFSATLTGANNAFLVTSSNTYSCRRAPVVSSQGGAVYCDLYRTEAGGSIPRLVQSKDITAFPGYGCPCNFIDNASDATQQTGAALYTQGADGSVSGRLPLGLASPATVLAETDGKLYLGGLERDNQVHFSIESRPGEAIGFVNDNLFFIQNPEEVTAVVAGEGGRRLLFGPKNIREIVGPGPNSAGVGDISEPVEIETRVGAVDWRSVCKTEHGIFFQSSAEARPRIYLLPAAGGAIDASQGITDLLAAFPVITSSTRHDEEQLLTFALQNSAGTDGRLLHLDLRTSGFGKAGWQGTWIVDRVASLEAAQFPRILEERIHVFPVVFGTGTVTVPLPRARRVDDRVLVIATGLLAGSSGALTIGTVTGMADTALASIIAGLKSSATDFRQTSATVFTTDVVVTYNSATLDSALIVKTFLIRGAHASSAPEASSVVNGGSATFTVPALVPTWGSAKNLWIGAAIAANASTDAGFPVVNGIPASFGGATRTSTRQGTSVAARQFEGTTLGAVFTAFTSVIGPAWLIAYRPLATSGTPVRATTRYRGRLVACNSTDIIRSEPTAIADLGSSVIVGEWEHADIHPMGPGGAGRHLGVGLMFELLGNSAVYAWFSYDGGVNWSAVREFRFSPTTGFQLGQQCKVRWVPARRKIDRVRMRLVIADDTTVSAGGATRGIALQRVTHWFEDLAGPARRQVSVNNVGDRR